MKSPDSFCDEKDPEPERSSFSDDAGAERPRAWEMIEKGRYQPRRIRGSLLGRELG
jgi:hypothetical protein